MRVQGLSPREMKIGKLHDLGTVVYVRGEALIYVRGEASVDAIAKGGLSPVFVYPADHDQGNPLDTIGGLIDARQGQIRVRSKKIEGDYRHDLGLNAGFNVAA